MSSLGRPKQSVIDSVAKTTEMNFFTDLEAGSLRSKQGWCLLRLISLVYRRPPSVLTRSPFVPVCVLISSSYKDTSRSGLGPTLKTSV